MRILKLIFSVVFKTLLITLFILNFVFVMHTNNLLLLFDEKTDMMNQTMSNYHKYTVNLMEEHIQQPNIKKLLNANVLLMSLTEESLGAGVLIKKNNIPYILSVSHLGKRGDVFVLMEKDKPYLIELVRWDDEVDLALFKFLETPEDLEFVNISKKEADIGDSVTCVGNPANLEDAVTTGIIMQKTYCFAPMGSPK